MKCPSCGGEAYVIDEEFIKAIENTNPVQIVVKQTFLCKNCSDKFTRIVCEDTSARKKTEEKVGDFHSLEPSNAEMKDAMDRLRFI
jgi:C4-type Zn-finger protein